MPIEKTTGPVPNAYHLFETTFGLCGIAWNDAGLCRVQLPDMDILATEQRVSRGNVPRSNTIPAAVRQTIDLLNEYFHGAPIEFSELLLDFSGIGPFEGDIYRALRKVAHGRTTTYGALAKQVGSPDAARAVGMAMGRNPWPVVVPCHRVLGADQAMVGFSAPGGITTKQKLLRLEGAGGAEQLSLFG